MEKDLVDAAALQRSFTVNRPVPWVASAIGSAGDAIIPLYLPDAPLSGCMKIEPDEIDETLFALPLGDA